MRDEIIKMALEAGMEQDGENFFSPDHEEIDVHITDLERFFHMAQAAEREVAIEITEAMLRDDPFDATAAAIQVAIRARGQA